MLSGLGLVSFRLRGLGDSSGEFRMANLLQAMQSMMVRTTRYPSFLFGRQGVPVRDDQDGCPATDNVSTARDSCVFVSLRLCCRQRPSICLNHCVSNPRPQSHPTIVFPDEYCNLSLCRSNATAVSPPMRLKAPIAEGLPFWRVLACSCYRPNGLEFCRL